MNDDPAMIAEPLATDRCAHCNVTVQIERAFCHFYHDEIRISLCSPDCAHAYLTGRPAASTGGERGLDELMADLRWREWGE